LRREKFALKSLKNLLEKFWRIFEETSPNYLLNISKEKSTWVRFAEAAVGRRAYTFLVSILRKKLRLAEAAEGRRANTFLVSILRKKLRLAEAAEGRRANTCLVSILREKLRLDEAAEDRRAYSIHLYFIYCVKRYVFSLSVFLKVDLLTV
jgi:hypothetical protein